MFTVNETIILINPNIKFLELLLFLINILQHKYYIFDLTTLLARNIVRT
jgi:hypothetical protein